ncbi:glycosyltransferase family 39 protein [Cyclobacterium sp. 1_MG-2023]|uniref:ArnT family glycosyltransferase n=1 Tax=Cyclobacterium sp. 1_MG-2023 TaxID=3062681 RepID=UPI0026E341AD|nr:glycosyltransferase family 39 protein [Cyclobacterium sp. 1_MG-2023]MDO6436103.1 glycosyltransferase family 39 protein [Cyclobacterium sp. 1_MG-2023]
MFGTIIKGPVFFVGMNFYEQKWFPYLFILVGLGVHFMGIGAYSIYILDEAKNAAAAMEMYQNQESIMPTFNGLPRYDKPPLHYYFFIMGYEIFGINAVGARFFSAMAGSTCFVLVYLLSNKLFGRKSAFYAGLALLSSIHWQLQFHLAVPDPFLITFLFLTLISYERYVSALFQSKYYLYAAALFLALATLSKGPVAIVLIGLTVFFYMVLDKRPLGYHIRQVVNFKALLIYSIISLPWYVLISIQTKGVWLKEFIFHHNLNRFSSAMEGHGAGALLTLIFVAVGFIPGIAALIPAIIKVYKSRKPPVIIVLALLFSTVTIIFFMVSGTKLPNYTAPVYPFLALMVGWYFSSVDPAKFKGPSIVASLLIFIIPLALFLPQLKLVIPEINNLSIWFFIPSILGCIGLFLSFDKKYEKGWLLTCLGYICFTGLLFYDALPSIDTNNPVSQSKNLWINNNRLFYFRAFNPAFVFNSKQRIPSIEDPKYAPKAGDLIITNNKNLNELEETGIKASKIFEGADLFEGSVTVIMRVYEEELFISQ